MLRLTFMAAKLGRLCKTVRPTGIEPYPNAAQFKSHLQAVGNLDQMLAALRTHAAQGHCLLVGELTTPLNDWGRRAGLANRNAPLSWLVVDVDRLSFSGLPEVWTEPALADVAEQVIAKLDHPALDGASYIAQAATKLGLAPNRASLHLFFLLEKPVRAHEAKEWLKRLNLTSDTLQQNIGLSANGFALTWPVDLSCADVGRLIYLAPPFFDGVANPFPDDSQRFVLVRKRKERLDLAEDDLRVAKRITNVEHAERRLKRDLRAAAGLNPSERERLRTVTLGGRTIELLTNPNKGALRFAHKARGYCYYNLNDGDSASYYHEEGRPDIIHNFKGEPSFRWGDVDPAGYEAYCNENAALIAKADPVNVFMVVNQHDDKIYKVWHDHEHDSVTVVQSSRDQVKDFYAEYGKVEPIFLPTWRIEFTPDSTTRVDYLDKTINQFNPTPFMRDNENRIGNVSDMLKTGAYDLWATLCPSIAMLLKHVSGDAPPEEQDLFINWLAFIFQKRRKTQTMWIFQGTEGTGKGTLFDRVLEPIFGVANTTMRTNHVFNDGFDAWRAKTLLIALDEFELPANNSSDAALAKLRNWVTEERTAVRAMRKIAEDTPLYENYIAFSNRHNILRIPEGDRRFNIFPRQEKRLNTVCNTYDLYNTIDDELGLFANVLHYWQVDDKQAMEAHTNHAKLAARAAGFTTTDEFALAMKHGEIDFFTEVFNLQPSSQHLAENQAARHAVSRAILNMGEPTFITASEMAAIYNTMNDSRMNPMHFGKMIARHGIESVRLRADGRQQRGFNLTLRADSQHVETLQAFVRRQQEGQPFSVVEGGRA